MLAEFSWAWDGVKGTFDTWRVQHCSMDPRQRNRQISELWLDITEIIGPAHLWPHPVILLRFWGLIKYMGWIGIRENTAQHQAEILVQRSGRINRHDAYSQITISTEGYVGYNPAQKAYMKALEETRHNIKLKS